jgi:hypothetical protein
MSIQVREVSGKAEFKQFIYLPAKIHQNHPNWVPPIYMDDWEYFNPQKNKSFSYSDTVLYLAWNDGRAVGRIMGIIVRPYNENHREKHVRFSWMETENDPEVFNALMHAVGEWGKAKGMTHIVGPLGFSDKDPQGFLTEGYEETVVIASNCNFPYMVELTEKYGFQPKENLVVYKFTIPQTKLPIISRIEERYRQRNTDLKVVEFTSRRSVKPYIHRALGLVNQTFNEIYGFWPYTEKEMDDFANRFLYLINPRYIKIVINRKEEAVAFLVGMSDISKGLQKAKGKLIPFGWIHVIRASRKTRQLNLLLGAIRPDYQGRGLDMLMAGRLFESAHQTGKTFMDSHLELEQNTKVRAEMERLGGKVYKRFRIFIKSLEP